MYYTMCDISWQNWSVFFYVKEQNSTLFDLSNAVPENFIVMKSASLRPLLTKAITLITSSPFKLNVRTVQNLAILPYSHNELHIWYH